MNIELIKRNLGRPIIDLTEYIDLYPVTHIENMKTIRPIHVKPEIYDFLFVGFESGIGLWGFKSKEIYEKFKRIKNSRL